MRKLMAVVFMASAAVALAQVTPSGTNIRTFPPELNAGATGGSGPVLDSSVEELFSPSLTGVLAQRINDNGEMVGWGFIGPNAQAAIYRGGAWVQLGTQAPYDLSAGFGISPSGATVGFAFHAAAGPDNQWRAYYTAVGGTTLIYDTVFQPIVPHHDAFLYAINDALDRTGCKNRDDDIFPDPHNAALWKDGSATLFDTHAAILAAAGGGNPLLDFTCARAINASGNTAGEFQSSSAPQRGWFMTYAGAVTILGPFPGSTPPYLTNARGMNASDVVVGEGRLNGSWTADHAMKWSAGVFSSDGAREHPGAPFNSRPNDINSLGDTCGMMFLGVGEHAYISIGGVAYDLNDYHSENVVLQECLGLNTSRTMVTRGYHNATPATTRYYRVQWAGP